MTIAQLIDWLVLAVLASAVTLIIVWCLAIREVRKYIRDMKSMFPRKRQ